MILQMWELNPATVSGGETFGKVVRFVRLSLWNTLNWIVIASSACEKKSHKDACAPSLSR